MKLRKFVGETSRAVLDQVRAVFGPDAIIVANRATETGIEITAVSGDAIAGLLDERNAAAGKSSQAQASRNATPQASQPATGTDDGVRVTLSDPAARPRFTDGPLETQTQHSEAIDSEPAAEAEAAAPEAARAAEIGLTSRLADEVAAMRKMLAEQIEQLTLSDSLKRSPLRARALRELLQAGYSPAMARPLVQRMPDDYSAAQAHAWVVEALTRSLACVDIDDDLVRRGGVYALVGPTGVGKTTTTAKLAARCAVRYGTSSLALLTTDSYRVGGQDQLRIYARILGITVQPVADRADLRHALQAAQGKHLVLIDTVGLGQRDRRLDEQVALLDEPDVRRVLLLNAATQAETLDEVVCRYGITGRTGERSFAPCD